MGLLRLMLAVSVLVSHALPHRAHVVMVGGTLAVQLFFIISGFYMTLILNEKYIGAGSTAAFFRNRLIRILPAYYLSLALPLGVMGMVGLLTGSLGGAGAIGIWERLWDVIGFPWKIGVFLVHVLVVGQEYLFLGSISDLTGSFIPTEDFYAEGRTPCFYLLLNPPTWSVAVELGFYLLAPWLVRGSIGRPLLVLAAALALRGVALEMAGPNKVFWSVHFMPCQLGFFMLGALGWHLLQRLRNGVRAEHIRWLSWLGLCAGILLVVLFPAMPARIRGLACIIGFAGCVPLAFRATEKLGFDRTIGELSYPVYLTHTVAIALANYAGAASWAMFASMPDIGYCAVVMAICLGLSIFTYRFVERPFQAARAATLRRLSASRHGVTSDPPGAA